jgi:amino acid adenylation domain-containing protein
LNLPNTIPQRILAASRVHQDNPAICTARHAYSYAELVEQTKGVAAALQIRTGDRVALLFEHGAEMIAGMLGVSFAGGIYIPLNVQWPDAKLRQLINDCDPACLLTHGDRYDRAKRIAKTKAAVLKIEACSPTKTFEGPPDLDPTSPAYILYTSGSTGSPKGVLQTHGGLIGNIDAYRKLLKIDTADRLSLLASYAFDASVMDIYGALFSGASLWPIRPWGKHLSALKSALCSLGITIYHSTPTLFRAIMKTAHPIAKMSCLRFVVLGGETATQKDLHLFRCLTMPSARLINAYGPTECSVALQSSFNHTSEVDTLTLPIGRPLPGVSIALRLNERRVPAEAPDPGEICLSSPCLAHGYWKRPGLTSKSFYTGNNRRWYKSGDIGRWLPDGSLLYMGRHDDQVKISGHKVLINEVEACLRKIPHVVDCAIVAEKDELQGYKLVAFVVSNKPASSNLIKSLRSALAKQLPVYMIPSRCVWVKQLPRNPNGKVDRQELRQRHMPAAKRPRLSKSDAGIAYQITQIWQDVFAIEDAIRDADIFEYGGSSLDALSFVCRLQQELKIVLPLEMLYEKRTLGAIIDAVQPTKPPSDPELSANASRRLPGQITCAPLSFPQERYWARIQHDPKCASAFNVAVETFIEGQIDPAVMASTLKQMGLNFDILRMCFDGQTGEARQRATNRIARLKYCDISEHSDAETEAAEIAAKLSIEPFDLAVAPLLRAHLIKTGRNMYRMITVWHHLITDSWSRDNFNRYFSKIYSTLIKKGHHPHLTPPSYIRYAYWQRKSWLESTACQTAVRFWKQKLDQPPEPALLPYDPKRSLASHASEIIASHLSTELNQAVYELVDETSCTPFIFFLTVTRLLLHAISDKENITVTTDVANRFQGEVADHLGLFTNVLILTSQIRTRATFREQLRREKSQTFESFEKQHAPFPIIMDEIFPGRLGQYDQLFPVGYFYQGRRPEEISLPQATVQSREMPIGECTRDLLITVDENDGQFRIEFEYRSVLFSEETMQRLMFYFTTLIAHILHWPDQSIRTIFKSVADKTGLTFHAVERPDR